MIVAGLLGVAGWSPTLADDAPRTSWGVPDLGGAWGFGGSPLSRTEPVPIVVEPADGRIPGLTEAALWRMAEMRERMERPPRTPADRPPETRCIVGFNAGPPMSSGEYNNLLRIVQAPGVVALMTEMVNDHRVVATDGGEPLPAHVRFWKGHSVGRWSGETFVVETRNFTPHTSFWGSGPDMHLTERFTRIDRNTLRYEYTVDDPMFEAPWSVRQNFVRTNAFMHEYACHEGNHGLMLQMRAAKQQYDAGDPQMDGSWLPSWFAWVPTKAELLSSRVDDGTQASEGDDG